MKVLFDVTHPALVHLFRHPHRELADRGHDLTVASREKDVTTDLLDAFDIDHVPVSSAGDAPLSRVGELLDRTRGLLGVARSFRPDVVVSQVDPAAVAVAAVVGARSVVFDDSEAEWLAASVTHPLADAVCTPAEFDRNFGRRQRRYDGFHELAYLHPDRFTPDRARLRRAGVDPDEPYFVVRFVSWTAHHDLSRRGFSPAGKRALVRELSDHGRVFVSSETELPSGLDAHRLPVEPDAVHDLLACADCYVGDSQTMATEAAVLGTPAVRSNAFVGDDDMSNFVELEERYGLLRSVADEDAAIEAALEFARSADRLDRESDRTGNESDRSDCGPDPTDHERRRDRLVEEKTDVASFVVEVIEEVGAA